jgi:ribosomal protein S7
MELKKKQYKKTLYNSFVNSFILKGKKKKAKSIVDGTLFSLSKSTGISLVKLLFNIYLKLDYFIEIKEVKIKRRTYTIPFSISYSRRIYLIIKKIKSATESIKRKTSFSENLKVELYNILKLSNNSKALKLLRNNQAQSKTSRSNIHFRWK